MQQIGGRVREILLKAYDQDVSRAAVKYYGFDIEGKDKDKKYKGVQGALRKSMELAFTKRVCYAIDTQGNAILKCDACNLRYHSTLCVF